MKNVLKLFAYIPSGKKATSRNVNRIAGFTDKNLSVKLWLSTDKVSYVLRTSKGKYNLIKHPFLDIYHGKCNGHDVYFSKKILVGELTYC
jgi:hypothetical protein